MFRINKQVGRKRKSVGLDLDEYDCLTRALRDTWQYHGQMMINAQVLQDNGQVTYHFNKQEEAQSLAFKLARTFYPGTEGNIKKWQLA